MSQEHSVSRRASLKSLGVAGAALALGGTAAAGQVAPGPAGGAQDKPTGNVGDLAMGRFAKGHS